MGGTASEIGGGKFANGAATASFSYLFSNGLSQGRSAQAGQQQAQSFGERLLGGALDVVGKIWTLPNTAVGLVAGLAGVPFGAEIRFANNAIWFETYPWGDGAITIGNTVLSTPGWGPDASRFAYGIVQPIGPHEQAHTYQYQALGPLFAPAYLLSGYAFTGNSRFEQAATRYATTGRGWWPY